MYFKTLKKSAYIHSLDDWEEQDAFLFHKFKAEHLGLGLQHMNFEGVHFIQNNNLVFLFKEHLLRKIIVISVSFRF